VTSWARPGPEEELPPGDNPRARYLAVMRAAVGAVASQKGKLLHQRL